MLLLGFVAGAIAGGLIEFLLGFILPEKPTPRHILAIIVAIIVFAAISILTSPERENISPNGEANSLEANEIYNSTIIQSAEGDVTINQPQPTSIIDPTQTPDVTSLYTYFPPPTMNSMRTYDFFVSYSDFSEGSSEQIIETEAREKGNYSEVVRIVNDKYQSEGITIVGIERIGGGDYLAPCPDKFYWYVYDANRFYIICSKNYVDAVGSQIAVDTAPNLVVNSQFEADSLNITPHYLAPFEINKRWQADYRIEIQEKVTKETPLGTFNDCFKILFFMIHYQEFRYVCPFVGVVATEVTSRGDFYSAQLTSLE